MGIYDLIGHVYAVQEIWHSRVTGGRLAPDFEVFPHDVDLARLREAHETWGSTWERYVEDLAPDALEEKIAYRTTEGTDHGSLLGDILTHVVNHGTHHRAQVVSALRRAGHEPPATDFIYFTRDP